MARPVNSMGQEKTAKRFASTRESDQAAVQKKIQSGYYLRPEVLSEIARRLSIEWHA